MAQQRGSRDEFSRGELREKQEKQENQKQYQVLCHPTVTQNLGHSLALLFLALRPSKPHIYKKSDRLSPIAFYLETRTLVPALPRNLFYFFVLNLSNKAFASAWVSPSPFKTISCSKSTAPPISFISRYAFARSN